MIESTVVNLATPGVYTQELSAFPNSVVAVPTAIPAFIGYTPRADYKGKSLYGVPRKISSLADFLTYYGVMQATPGATPTPAPPGQQYDPIFYLSPSAGLGDLAIGGKPYDLLPDAGTIFYLYNSIRLFYANGGGDAYVVALGNYGKPVGKAMPAGADLVNPNVKLADFQQALVALADEDEPTMLVAPDANLLKSSENATLMQSMIQYAGTNASMIAVLDVQAGLAPDPMAWQDAITTFRTNVGINFLNYATAYFPFLRTTITASSDLDFTNAGGAAALSKILPEYALGGATKTIIDGILKPPANPPSTAQSNAALLMASDSYAQIAQAVLDRVNTLPPSGAMVGMISLVDNSAGVWTAPANVSLTGVTDTTFKITDAKQANLNIDAATGKSINCIRMFIGQGVLVWGARTLDGNSEDWRYLNVRRTLLMIEKSVKLAARAYVFEANDANTWSTVASSLNAFLTGLWRQGALAGATPADAFTVAVGLGTTMTAQDILDGRMNIQVTVAVTHPAEFIVITYVQQMQKS
ncbi:MAG TPA: phage tail sheath C-terminal domain-containing protein [Kofleriaceae bacterium]|nr:phage tail sheath C-terminal domain-containing protein [Kofleriaceae bacterium]